MGANHTNFNFSLLINPNYYKFAIWVFPDGSVELDLKCTGLKLVSCWSNGKPALLYNYDQLFTNLEFFSCQDGQNFFF